MSQENKDRFFSRIEPMIAPSEALKIRLAYYLAKYGHRAQYRKEIVNGEHLRYFEHLRRSALVLIDTLHCFDWELICALLLHDSLEDTEELTAELIELALGPRVARIVRVVSKIPAEGYTQRLACADPDTIIVKGCDRLDNVRSLVCEGTTEDFVRKQITETRAKYIPLLQKVAVGNAAPYGTMAQTLITEISTKLDMAQSWLDGRQCGNASDGTPTP